MRQVNRLSAQFVRKRSVAPGKYPDGNNLYLYVSSETARSWVFRYTLKGVEYERGLGSAWDIDLADAREKALELRRMLKSGIDPSIHFDPPRKPTFGEVLIEFVDVFSSRWTNKKSPHQWLKTAEYVGSLANMPVDEITTADIKAALLPHWSRIEEVASRTRGRIEQVLDYAKHHGYRSGDNPARWKGCLEYVLPPHQKEEKHHAALPYGDVAEFYSALSARAADVALAFRYCILTGARTEEVRMARWEEIDLSARIWSLPRERMKARRPYRVPLSDAAIDILKKLGPRDQGFVFERESGKPFSNNALLALRDRMGFKGKCTTHGFRSSFRDWAQSRKIDRVVAEMCLDHKVLNKTEAAYMRSDLLDERREVLEAWASFVTRPSDEGIIVELKRVKK